MIFLSSLLIIKDKKLRIFFAYNEEASFATLPGTFEYPIIDSVEPHELVAQMGLGFKQDLKTKVASYGSKQAEALEVMLAANWK